VDLGNAAQLPQGVLEPLTEEKQRKQVSQLE
jgi:hypothetical protein